MTQVLMSPENPGGWKLEDLLSVLRDEILAKTNKIKDDRRPVAVHVTRNNRAILSLLSTAEDLQRDNYAKLDAFKKDEGPLGTPRIGTGSN